MSKRSSKKSKSNSTAAAVQGKLLVNDDSKGPFVQLPSDMLYELSSHLQPLDLLHLTRCSSDLRSTFLGKAAKPFWVRSFENLRRKGFPPCPQDLSEPQYANLMFSIHCHDCMRDDDDSVYYLILLARTRLCVGCARGRFKPPKDLGLTDKLPSDILKGIPYTNLKFFPLPFSTANYPNDSRFGERKYCAREAAAVAKEYRKLGKGKDVKGTWIKQRSGRLDALLAHATAYYQYEKSQRQEQIVADKVATESRIASIRQRLVEGGWSEELAYLKDHKPLLLPQRHDWFVWESLEGVSISRPLNDAGWQKLRPEIELWLSKVRELRSWDNRAAKVATRVKDVVEPIYRGFILSQSKDTPGPYPSIAEVCLIPEFSALLEDTENDLTQDSFSDTLALLPTFIAKWRLEREEDLISIIGKSKIYSSSKPAPTVEVLQHASTVFRCSSTIRRACLGTATYPEVLVHPCFMRPLAQLVMPRPRSAKVTDIWRKAVDQYVGIWKTTRPTPKAGQLIHDALGNHLVFTTRDINFSDAVFVHMEALLDLCDLPLSTTQDEMQTVDPYVLTQCTCFTRDNIMRWGAVAQLRSERPNHRRPIDPVRLFSLPSEEQAAEVTEMRESRLARGRNWDKSGTYYCVLCSQLVPASPDDNQAEIEHLKAQHGVSSDVAIRFISLMLIERQPYPDFRHVPRPEAPPGKTKTVSAAELKALET